MRRIEVDGGIGSAAVVEACAFGGSRIVFGGIGHVLGIAAKAAPTEMIIGRGGGGS